jgi:hypothetical protein
MAFPPQQQAIFGPRDTAASLCWPRRDTINTRDDAAGC